MTTSMRNLFRGRRSEVGSQIQTEGQKGSDPSPSGPRPRSNRLRKFPVSAQQNRTAKLPPLFLTGNYADGWRVRDEEEFVPHSSHQPFYRKPDSDNSNFGLARTLPAQAIGRLSILRCWGVR